MTGSAHPQLGLSTGSYGPGSWLGSAGGERRGERERGGQRGREGQGLLEPGVAETSAAPTRSCCRQEAQPSPLPEAGDCEVWRRHKGPSGHAEVTTKRWCHPPKGSATECRAGRGQFLWNLAAEPAGAQSSHRSPEVLPHTTLVTGLETQSPQLSKPPGYGTDPTPSPALLPLRSAA